MCQAKTLEKVRLAHTRNPPTKRKSHPALEMVGQLPGSIFDDELRLYLDAFVQQQAERYAELCKAIDAAGEISSFFEMAMGQNVDGEFYSSVWGAIHALSEDRSECKKRVLEINTVTKALGKNISCVSADASLAVVLNTMAQSSVSAWQSTMQSTHLAKMALETKKDFTNCRRYS